MHYQVILPYPSDPIHSAGLVSILGLTNAVGKEVKLATVAKLAFEHIWGPEIKYGVFDHGEYNVTGNGSPINPTEKK